MVESTSAQKDALVELEVSGRSWWEPSVREIYG